MFLTFDSFNGVFPDLGDLMLNIFLKLLLILLEHSHLLVHFLVYLANDVFILKLQGFTHSSSESFPFLIAISHFVSL